MCHWLCQWSCSAPQITALALPVVLLCTTDNGTGKASGTHSNRRCHPVADRLWTRTEPQNVEQGISNDEVPPPPSAFEIPCSTFVGFSPAARILITHTVRPSGDECSAVCAIRLSFVAGSILPPAQDQRSGRQHDQRVDDQGSHVVPGRIVANEQLQFFDHVLIHPTEQQVE